MQKALIVDDNTKERASELNKELADGWKVINMQSFSVSAGTGSYMHGTILVILEK